MIKKFIILGMFSMLGSVYAENADNATSTAPSSVKISDFKLISQGSSQDCDKYFTKTLEKGSLDIQKGKPVMLHSGQKVKHKDHVKKSYADYNQVLATHKITFEDGRKADVAVGFTQNKTDAGASQAATGLMVIFNWKKPNGDSEDRSCIFSFKETPQQ